MMRSGAKTMKEATLVVYSDEEHTHNWRGNVIDNDDGKSIYCTEWMPTREQAMLNGAMAVLERGYKIWLGGVQRPNR